MGKSIAEWEQYQASLETERLAVEAERLAQEAERERMIAGRKTTKFDPKTQPRLNGLFLESAAGHIADQKAAQATPPEWVTGMHLPPGDPLVLAEKQRVINGTEPAGGAQ